MIYDNESNLASWELLTKGKIVKTVKFGNFILHLSSANTPILIEVLDASNFRREFVSSKFNPDFLLNLLGKNTLAVSGKLESKIN